MCAERLEDIFKRSHVIVHDNTDQKSPDVFSKKSFYLEGEENEISLNDENFWEKVTPTHSPRDQKWD